MVLIPEVIRARPNWFAVTAATAFIAVIFPVLSVVAAPLIALVWALLLLVLMFDLGADIGNRLRPATARTGIGQGFFSPSGRLVIFTVGLASALLQVLSLGFSILLYGGLLAWLVVMTVLTASAARARRAPQRLVWAMHGLLIALFAIVPSADSVKNYNALWRIAHILFDRPDGWLSLSAFFARDRARQTILSVPMEHFGILSMVLAALLIGSMIWIWRTPRR